MSMSFPSGFSPHGTHIHVSDGYGPHLRGDIGGRVCHLDYYGQTTLPMFEKGVGHDVGSVNSLHAKYPALFRDSGLGPTKY